MQPIAIFAPVHKRRPVQAARRLIEQLTQGQIPVRLYPRLARALRREDLAVDTEMIAVGAGLVISLGGDGSALAATRAAAPVGTPVLGVNVGGLGFLTELDYHRLEAELPRVLAGDYQISERMMLAVAVLRGGEEVNSQFALNDLVVTKGPLARLMRLEARVDGQPLASFAADGVIIATPGGSTAYSLSAGGPLVAPEVRAMLLTPICAHTLSMRPLVVPAHARLEVSVGRIEREQQVVATVDGQVAYPLEAKDVVSITQAPFPARLVTLGGPGFYEKLRTKLGWGD